MIKNITWGIEWLKNSDIIIWDKKYHIIGHADKNIISEIQDSIQQGIFDDKFYINDNHCHTDLTDGILSPRRLVDCAIMEWITNLTVTDHNTILPALQAEQYARSINEKNTKEVIKVNIGIELSTDSGHIILVNIPKDLPFNFPQQAKYSIQDYHRRYKEYIDKYNPVLYPGISLKNALDEIDILKQKYPDIKVILPHPFDGNEKIGKLLNKRGSTNFFGLMFNLSQKELKHYLDRFDFIEWYDQNSQNLQDTFGRFWIPANTQAIEFMAKNKDSHNFISWTDTHVGSFKSFMIVKKEDENIFDTIGKWEFIIVKQEDQNLKNDSVFLKNMINKLWNYAAKTDTNIFSNEVKFYMAWALWSMWIGDYFINEHKKDGWIWSQPNIINEKMDLMAKQVRKILYSMSLKSRLYDILNYKYQDDEIQKEKIKHRLKNIQNPWKRFYDNGK